MPPARVVVFQSSGGHVPFLDWFQGLDGKARATCRARLELLALEGFSLRRPLVDYLQDGVYELRFKIQAINFRVLYFFHDRNTVDSRT